jgi:large subunit ribosomal protein L15
MKIKKRKKSTRDRGSHTNRRGFKKKARGKGHRGGIGMSGTGKRADHKKTLVLKLHGNKYFGKDKTLRKKTKIKLKSINLDQITKDKTDLTGYKILSRGQPIKNLKIKASAASKTAIEKIKQAQGEIILVK